MADFFIANPYVLQNEGGYASIDGDTYRGIARRFFPGWPGWAVIDAHMPLKQGAFYTSEFTKALLTAEKPKAGAGKPAAKKH